MDTDDIPNTLKLKKESAPLLDDIKETMEVGFLVALLFLLTLGFLFFYYLLPEIFFIFQ